MQARRLLDAAKRQLQGRKLSGHSKHGSVVSFVHSSLTLCYHWSLKLFVCVSHTNFRYFSDIALHGLEVLQLVTLSPLPRRAVTASAAGNSIGSSGSGRGAGGARSGMAILLHAASTGNAQPFYGLADPEVCRHVRLDALGVCRQQRKGLGCKFKKTVTCVCLRW